MKSQNHRDCCPVCGQRVLWSRMYLRSWTWAAWPCESCGTLLRFRWANRLLCALLIGVWIGFWGIFVLPHVALWVGIVVYAIGVLPVLQVDRISLAKPTQPVLEQQRKEDHP